MTILFLSLMACPSRFGVVPYADTADTAAMGGLSRLPTMDNVERTWADLSVGYGGLVCALDVDGHVGCWTPSGAAAWFPEGVFAVVAVADIVPEDSSSPSFNTPWSCAAGPAGLACWDDKATLLDVGGPWTEVSVADDSACGITGDGEMVCFEREDPTVVWTQDPGPLHDVALGYRGGCAIDAADRPRCWDLGGSGLASGLPEGELQDLGVYGKRACAVRTDGSYACWGDDNSGTPPTLPPLVAIEPGESHDCGVDEAGELYCWNGYGPVVDVEGPMPRPAFDTGAGLNTATGGYGYYYGTQPQDSYICAVDGAAAVRCWQDRSTPYGY